MTTTKFNNITEQMQHAAEQIIPGVCLTRLLSRPIQGRGKSEEDRAKIRKLINPGSLYLNANWLASYYPVSEQYLNVILNTKNQKK